MENLGILPFLLGQLCLYQTLVDTRYLPCKLNRFQPGTEKRFSLLPRLSKQSKLSVNKIRPRTAENNYRKPTNRGY